MPMTELVSRPWEVEEGLGVAVGLEDTTVVPAAGVWTGVTTIVLPGAGDDDDNDDDDNDNSYLRPAGC